jgi:hypothetical protein
MSVDEFKSSPDAQTKVFNGEFGSYLKKALATSPDEDTAIRKAAAGWYGGEGRMEQYDNPTRFKPDEPSFREYTQGVLNRTKKGQTSTPDYSFAQADVDKIVPPDFSFAQKDVDGVLKPPPGQALAPDPNAQAQPTAPVAQDVPQGTMPQEIQDTAPVNFDPSQSPVNVDQKILADRYQQYLKDNQLEDNIQTQNTFRQSLPTTVPNVTPVGQIAAVPTRSSTATMSAPQGTVPKHGEKTDVKVGDENYDENGNLLDKNLQPIPQRPTQEVNARDWDSFKTAVSDTISLPSSVRNKADAEKYLAGQLQAKYPGIHTGDFHLVTDFKPGQNIDVSYGDLARGGVDVNPMLQDKINRERVENPQPNLQVGRNFAQDTADDIKSAIDSPYSGVPDLAKDPTAAAIGGLLGSGGTTAKALAGILQIEQEANPLMHIPGLTEGTRPADGLVKYLQDASQNIGQVADATQSKYTDTATPEDKGYLEGRPIQRNTWGSTIARTAGQLTGDFARMVIYPGGPAVQFASDSALQAAGEGNKVDWSKVALEGAKGYALGKVGEVAPGIGKLAEPYTGKILSKGVELGTVGVGSGLVSKAFGDSNKDSFSNAVLFTLLHASSLGGHDVVDTPIRVQDERGNAAVVEMSKDGDVKTVDPKTNAQVQVEIPETTYKDLPQHIQDLQNQLKEGLNNQVPFTDTEGKPSPSYVDENGIIRDGEQAPETIGGVFEPPVTPESDFQGKTKAEKEAEIKKSSEEVARTPEEVQDTNDALYTQKALSKNGSSTANVTAKPKKSIAKKGELTAPRETVTPAEDTPVGQNAAEEPLYERANGSRYRMRDDRKDRPNGYPDFGGDLAPIETAKKPVAEETPATPQAPEGTDWIPKGQTPVSDGARVGYVDTMPNGTQRVRIRPGEGYNGTTALNDQWKEIGASSDTKPEGKPSESATTTSEKVPRTYGSKNKLVTTDEYNKAKSVVSQKLKESTRTASSGLPVDPELAKALLRVASYHVEAGSRTFADYSKRMVDEMGDVVKPYLRAAYEYVRDNSKFTGMDKTFEDIKPEVLRPTGEVAKSESVKPERISADELKPKIGKGMAPDNVRATIPLKERGLSQTLDAAQLEKGSKTTYEPQNIPKDAQNVGQAYIADKGIDTARTDVLSGKVEPATNWASVGFGVMRHQAAEIESLRSTDPAKADELAKKHDDFINRFTKKATEMGQMNAGIRAVEDFAPDKMEYYLNKLSQKARNKGLDSKESEYIRKTGEEIQRQNDRIAQLDKQLAEAQKNSTKRTGGAKKSETYIDKLEKASEQAKNDVLSRIKNLNLGGLERQKATVGERGAIGVKKELPGDAELIAQYAAGRLHKVPKIEDLNKELTDTFGAAVEPHLQDIRQRAYELRQDARIKALNDRGATDAERRSILQDIQKESKALNDARIGALKASRESTDPQVRKDAMNQLKELDAQRAQKKAESLAAAKTNETAIARNLREARDATKKAAFWDTPVRELAKDARTRLEGANIKDPQTLSDLAAAGAEKWLNDKLGGTPSRRAISSNQWYREMDAEFPDLMKQLSKGQRDSLYKDSYQRIEAAKKAKQNAAQLANASEEMQKVWNDHGIDIDQQMLLIQKAEATSRSMEARSNAAREFNRVSKPLWKRAVRQAVDTPRPLMTSLNVHQGRQGLVAFLTHPLDVSLKQSIPATARGIAANPEEFTRLAHDFNKLPGVDLYKRFGGNLSELPSTSVSNTGHVEEDELRGNWTQSLPHVQRSQQGFILGMNMERLALFNKWRAFGEARGMTPEANPEFYKNIANLANAYTGRAVFGDGVEKVLNNPLIKDTLFAPRLKLSQVKVANELFNPFSYIKDDPVTRNLKAREAMRFTAGMALAYTTMVAVFGGESATDPSDTDFAKVKFGNTRYDLTAGFGGTAVFLWRLGHSIYNYETGVQQDKYHEPLEIAKTFLEKKLSPAVTFPLEHFTGKDVIGQPANYQFRLGEAYNNATRGNWSGLGKNAADDIQQNIILHMMLPMIVKEIAEGAEDSGVMGVFKTAPPAFLGVDEQTYQKKGGH